MATTTRRVNRTYKLRFLAGAGYGKVGHFPKIPAAWGGHYNLIGFCHTFFGLLPPDTYFKDHPEWYSEINGKRVHDKAQLCLSNEAMLAELTRNVLAAIRKAPDAGMISVSQNDWGGNCECARCRALDEAGGSPSASLLYGINRVAEAVEKEFPGFLVQRRATSGQVLWGAGPLRVES